MNEPYRHRQSIPTRRFGAVLLLALCLALISPAGVGARQRSYTRFTIHTSLRKPANVTGEQLDAFLRSRRPHSPLIGLGRTWVTVGREYQINPLFLMAHAIHESGWGASQIARYKHNIYGWRAYNNCAYSCAMTFKTTIDCVWTVAALIERQYLDPDGDQYTRYGATLYGLNVHYATDRHWKYSIADLMNEADQFIRSA
ncbi:MAG: hypothetical protein NVS4B8_30700 [Herpetosiphon sp.]